MTDLSHYILSRVRRGQTEALFEELEKVLGKIRDDCPGSYDRAVEMVAEMDPHCANRNVLADNPNAGNINAKKSASSKPKANPQMSIRAFAKVAVTDTSASVGDDAAAPLSNESKKRAAPTAVLANAVAVKKIKGKPLLCATLRKADLTNAQSTTKDGPTKRPVTPAKPATETREITVEMKCDANDPSGYCKLPICQSWRTKQGFCSHQHFKIVLCEVALTPAKKCKSAGSLGKGFQLSELDDDEEIPYIVKPEPQH
ncbi:hypothetical protein UCDDS831_g00951 [Diplodia seriata]|uniref:Uncharacterized protein n=1 Tax=Diplodia seriata TaxID=420778 RepID=A0A0G2EWS3_9PEZI|nr:hypothetical protein UCDDS831_g00951 [Diplodia seriata]